MGRRGRLDHLWPWLLALVACGGVEPGDRPEPRPTLVGTEWRLVALDGEPAPPSPRVTLEIEEGRFGGYAGCNWYGAELSTGGDTLVVGPIERTARGCEDRAAEELEGEFLRALAEVVSHRLEEDLLVLEGRRGSDRLRFEGRVALPMDPADLVGTAWRLDPAGATAALPTLRFGASTFEGFAGCRGFVGTWAGAGERLHVQSLTMNELECPDEDLLRLEGEFTTVLSETSRFRLDGERLELHTDSGRMLVFVADEE